LPGLTDGKDVCAKRCLTCHQEDGSGVPGMYQPLIKSDKVPGSPEELIRIVLSGLKSPEGVSGKSYDQEMPPND
jgi:mono/diheme cytochrome c family protein